jgi:hypothetical protein
MTPFTALRPQGALENPLRRSFTAGTRWPIDRASLAALLDMGMSNAQIAWYFAVAPDEVRRLREDYRRRAGA